MDWMHESRDVAMSPRGILDLVDSCSRVDTMEVMGASIRSITR